MNYQQHTLRELRAICSRDINLYRGYSRYNKADLIVFMNEKILIVPPWDLSEWYPRTSEQQYLSIQETLEHRIFNKFTEAERETMETLNKGRWISNVQIGDMTAHELVIFHIHNTAIDELDYNIFQVLNDVIEPEDEGGNLLTDDEILALTEIVRRKCIIDLKPPCPECPVCYERKSGMMVKTSCGHTFCFGCLDEAWKARCGTQKWMNRPCPICRDEVDDMVFI